MAKLKKEKSIQIEKKLENFLKGRLIKNNSNSPTSLLPPKEKRSSSLPQELLEDRINQVALNTIFGLKRTRAKMFKEFKSSNTNKLIKFASKESVDIKTSVARDSSSDGGESESFSSIDNKDD